MLDIYLKSYWKTAPVEFDNYIIFLRFLHKSEGVTTAIVIQSTNKAIYGLCPKRSNEIQ